MRLKASLLCFILLFAIPADGESSLNVGLRVPDGYGSVYSGSDLVVELSVMNLRAENRVDVVVEYSVAREDGSVILSEHETVALETKASFVKSMRIPGQTSPGKYTVSSIVQVLNSDQNASASASFEVLEKPKDILSSSMDLFRQYIWLLAILVFLAFLLLGLRKVTPGVRMLILKNKVHSVVRKRLRKRS